MRLWSSNEPAATAFRNESMRRGSIPGDPPAPALTPADLATVLDPSPRPAVMKATVDCVKKSRRPASKGLLLCIRPILKEKPSAEQRYPTVNASRNDLDS